MGSLFGGGGLGASTTPKPSLFGSTNTTSAFGNTTAASAQPSSLFGQSQAQSQPQPQPPAQSSILGQTQQPAKNPQEQPQMSAQTTKPAFFNSLLERGKKRPLSATAQNGNFEDVPSLQLGLDDIRRKARELGTSGGKDPQQNSATTKA
jgi:nuclear pore complex protein Nup93